VRENNYLKILIVDDAALVVSRLFEILSELDCIEMLYKANSYNQATEAIKKNLPDLVLLDIQLPGKNGIELLRFIKKNYPDIITVMLTNRVSDYYKELCESMGANHFIDKSSEFEKIPSIIESYMPEKNI
jgi:DNA-binding NarL/FixJ family response regulator